MKLIYIYHSGFIIEGKDFSILTDFYKDSPGQYVEKQFLKRPGRLYVLSSHSHPDHFNPRILTWKNTRPDIRYIFSEDIRDNAQTCFHDAVYLKKGESWNDDLLKVKAFGSTDIGISFLIDVADKRIFHAGDLNNWHWEKESTPEEVQAAGTAFLQEVETLRQEAPRLDLALFPIDPRMGGDYARGARQFIANIQVKQLVPMHFWNKYEQANACSKEIEKCGTHFIAVHQQGEEVMNDES